MRPHGRRARCRSSGWWTSPTWHRSARLQNLPKLTAALEDPNEAIRWWGALGCAMLRGKAAPAEAALRKRLDDPSGAVQAAAADALAHLGHADLALPVLERWITNTSGTFYTLHAANVLIRLGESRPAAAAGDEEDACGHRRTPPTTPLPPT